jgi:hypothetical protein
LAAGAVRREPPFFVTIAHFRAHLSRTHVVGEPAETPDSCCSTNVVLMFIDR